MAKFIFLYLNLILATILMGLGCCEAGAAPRLNLFVIGGVQTDANNFAEYIEASGLSAEGIIFRTPDSNPFLADHVRDLKEYESLLQSRTNENLNDFVILAFSLGGKFAARLAQDNPNVRGIFLLDPVDGAPPFQNNSPRFPVFLKDGSPQINIPVFIYKSELGELPGLLGVPCVSKHNGTAHFMQFINPNKLQSEVASGSAHLDFMWPPIKFLATIACASSKEVAGNARKKALDSWSLFFQTLENEMAN